MVAASRSFPSLSSSVGAQSFDAPRVRPAPRELRGRNLAGDERTVELTSMTLIASVKPSCDGCWQFVHGDLHELAHVEVVVVSATDGEGEWSSAARDILVAPALLNELDIRSAPYYVLIDPATLTVVTEGALLSPSQVAQETERFL